MSVPAFIQRWVPLFDVLNASVFIAIVLCFTRATATFVEGLLRESASGTNFVRRTKSSLLPLRGET
jgi:hypothetical protein